MAEYLIIPIPAILGYATSMFCKVGKTSGETVAFRPPPIVFSLVWPILYILFGLSWFYSRKIHRELSDIFYSILTVLLCIWIFVYSCKNNKKYGIYVLLLSIIFAILCYTVADLKSRCLLAPLMGWLLFAMLLNIFEVQKI